MTGAHNAASIAAAIGASGSGKSLWIKGQLAAAKPARLLVWDPQGEYSSHGRTYGNREKLLSHVRQAPTFAAVYQPGDQLGTYAERFNWFCRLAYALGNVAVVVEELAEVTTPSRAPDGWSVLTRKGRHRAVRIVAASQRPASVDKDFLGNCTLIHCGRLTYGRDIAVMAAALSTSDARTMETKLAALAPLAYVERNMLTGEVREGTLARPAKRRGAVRT